MLSFNSSQVPARRCSGGNGVSASLPAGGTEDADLGGVRSPADGKDGWDLRGVRSPSGRTRGSRLVRARAIGMFAFVSLLWGSALEAVAFPVSTNETVEHAALLKTAPTYHEFPEQFQYQMTDSAGRSLKRMNLLEWKSVAPRDAYLLCFHAWGLSAREFNSFGEVMSSRGFDTAAIDVRGFGLDRKKHGMKRIDFPGTSNDAAKLLTRVRKESPEKKIFVVGESMGGAMALKVAAEHPELVDGVIVSAPAWQIYGVKRLTFEGLFDQIFGEPGFAARSVANMASSDPALRKQWMTDEAYRMNYSVPEAYDYYRLMRSTPWNAKHLKDIPVLILQGFNDRLSKPEAAATLFKKIGNAEKQFVIVGNSEHLVFEEDQLKEKVANFVEDWILNQMDRTKHVDKAPPVVIINGDAVPDARLNEIEKLKHLAGAT